jgi:hypothetical protein
MAKKIYIRLNDGRGISRSIEKVKSLLFNDDVAEVMLENDVLGTVSKNMARRIWRFKPEALHKRYHNALWEWLSDDEGIERDERDWLDQLRDAFS